MNKRDEGESSSDPGSGSRIEVDAAQIDHFQRQGFLLIANPFGAAAVEEIDHLERASEPRWEAEQWPHGSNRLACQFLMIGEPLLKLAERSDLLDTARSLLDCDEVHVGACGLGDSLAIVSADGRAQHQVHWHADGGPDRKQVSFRTALDRHGPDNAPLRVLAGSHRRDHAEVAEELRQLEIAGGAHVGPPELCFAAHPAEVEVVLDPGWTLVWTPSCWHATGIKAASGPRRAVGWNYYPGVGPGRDADAVKHAFAATWQDWSQQRKKLWGLS